METPTLTENETQLLKLLLNNRMSSFDHADRGIDDCLLEHLSKEITILTVLLQKLYRLSKDRIPEDSDLMDCILKSKYHDRANDSALNELYYMFKYT